MPLDQASQGGWGSRGRTSSSLGSAVARETQRRYLSDSTRESAASGDRDSTSERIRAAKPQPKRAYSGKPGKVSSELKAIATSTAKAITSPRVKVRVLTTEDPQASPAKAAKASRESKRSSSQYKQAIATSTATSTAKAITSPRVKVRVLTTEDPQASPAKAAKASRESERSSSQYKQGKFSQKETSIILDAVHRYAVENNISIERLCQAEGRISDLRGAWTRIAGCLPDRRVQAIYRHGIRKLHKGKRGPWTEAEVELLKSSVTEHGKKWRKIEELLGRHADQCRDKYREVLSMPPTSAKGGWEKQEEELLVRLVEEKNMKAGGPRNGRGEGTKTETMQWDDVSKMVGTRGRIACLQKWNYLQGKQREQSSRSHLEGPLYVSIALAKDVLGSGAEDESEVVWTKLPYHRAARRWKGIRELAPETLSMREAAKVVIDVLQQKVLRGESKVRRSESKVRKGKSGEHDKPELRKGESESREGEPLDVAPLEANCTKGSKSLSPGERGKPNPMKRKGVQAEHEDHAAEPHTTEAHAREHAGVSGTKKMRRQSLESGSQADPPPCSSPAVDGDARDFGSPQSLAEHSILGQSSPEGLSGEAFSNQVRFTQVDDDDTGDDDTGDGDGDGNGKHAEPPRLRPTRARLFAESRRCVKKRKSGSGSSGGGMKGVTEEKEAAYTENEALPSESKSSTQDGGRAQDVGAGSETETEIEAETENRRRRRRRRRRRQQGSQVTETTVSSEKKKKKRKKRKKKHPAHAGKEAEERETTATSWSPDRHPHVDTGCTGDKGDTGDTGGVHSNEQPPPRQATEDAGSGSWKEQGCDGLSFTDDESTLGLHLRGVPGSKQNLKQNPKPKPKPKSKTDVGSGTCRTKEKSRMEGMSAANETSRTKEAPRSEVASARTGLGRFSEQKRKKILRLVSRSVADE